MDFSLTEEQLMFQKMVADFATRELEPNAARYDGSKSLMELWLSLPMLVPILLSSDLPLRVASRFYV